MELFLCITLAVIMAGLAGLNWWQAREAATVNVALIINAHMRGHLRYMPFGLGWIATRLPMWVSEFAILSWYHEPVFIKSVIIQGKERRVRATVIAVTNTARVMGMFREYKSFDELASYLNKHVAWSAAVSILERRSATRWLIPKVTLLQVRFVAWVRNWERRYPGLTPMGLAVNDIVAAVRFAKQHYGATSFVLTGFTGISIFAEPAFKIIENDPELADMIRSTGNNPLPGVVCDATFRAAANANILPANATVAVVGITGSIGRAIALMLAPDVKHVLAIGRRPRSITPERLTEWGMPSNVVAAGPSDLPNANIIMVATSATNAVVRPEHISVHHRVVVADLAEPKGAPGLISGGLLTVLDGGKVYVVDGIGRKVRCPFGYDTQNPWLWPGCAAEGIATALTGQYDLATTGTTLVLSRCIRIVETFAQLGFTVEPGWRGTQQPTATDWWDRVPLLQEVRPEADRLATAHHAAA